MQQKGLVVNNSQIIDHLRYSYLQSGGWSNKLASVSDNAVNTAPLGDFKDGTNTGFDYSYDGNGNMLIDSNKGVNNIIYNFLNLPQQVSFKGKGVVKYVYDATGEKLKKIVTDSTVSPVKITTTTYSGAFLYTNDTLQFINNEEGRMRIKLINSSNGYSPTNIQYVYDYFIKDHLGNTRMVLTEETQQDTYSATMESGNAALENALFDSVSSTQYMKPTGFDTDTSNHYVSRLNANSSVNKQVGPSIVLKVMAGDTLTASVYGWYNSSVQPPSGPATLINSLIPALTTSAIGASGGHLVAAEQASVNSAFSSSLPSLISLKDAQYSSSSPKAFLNWALFDNRMNYVSGGVTQIPVINGGDYKQVLAANLPSSMQKNGYLYIYVSNESPQDVFFDNLTIQHHRGPLLEETHYYPFGLTMSGISDKALKKDYIQNRYRFNGKELQSQEFSDSSGSELYDYEARYQDPQLGLWHNLDPHADNAFHISPYVYALNNPVKLNDPTGMDPATDSVAVGADGLTNEQWVEASSPEADPTLGAQYRQFNFDINQQYGKAKEGDKKTINGQQYVYMGGKWIRIGTSNITGNIGSPTLFPSLPDLSKIISEIKKFAKYARKPDFITFSLAVNSFIPGAQWFGWNGTVTLDRYGHFYFSPLGVGAGKVFPGDPVSFSLTVNWMVQWDKPKPEELQSFLTGHSINLGAGNLLGGGVTWSPSDKDTPFAVGFGLYSKQAGISYNYTPPTFEYQVDGISW